MRISKIFHWLYASVMLMPIFAIGVKCLYTMINPNSKDSYYGETINETTYDRLYSFDEMISGNEYYYNNSFISTSGDRYETIINVANFEVLSNNMSSLDGIVVTNLRFYIYNNTDEYLRVNNLSTYTFALGTNSYQFKFTYLNGSNLDKNSALCYVFDVEHNNYSYLDNVFYYSVDQINNEPLFSWAQSSFLSQPLLFITNFFGVPSTSPILTILCYWFSISVIWLVFDAVMYFPLLIHRWLDKGVLE